MTPMPVNLQIFLGILLTSVRLYKDFVCVQCRCKYTLFLSFGAVCISIMTCTMVVTDRMEEFSNLPGTTVTRL